MDIYKLHVLIDKADSGDTQAKKRLEEWDSTIDKDQVWITNDDEIVCRIKSMSRKKVKLVDFFNPNAAPIYLSKNSLLNKWTRVF